ncbi:MAG: YwaF family protein [Oscillospiraceae bacterium]|nr:YwaF family protein [Oscillospiraceae bacterium]
MKQFFVDLFTSLAGEFPQHPEAWGLLHILFFAIGLSLAVFFAILLRNSSEKTFNRVLRTVGFVLCGMEVVKISFYYFAMHDCDLAATAYLFPFQLCSLPIYLAPIASYLKKESVVRKAMLTFMMTYTLMSGFSAFINPSGILMSHILPTFHSLIWHMLLVFIGLLIAISCRGGYRFRDFFRAFVLFIICCYTALFLNILIPTLLPEAGVNMFYLGPNRSSLIVFDAIYDRWDWVVQMKIYEISLSIGAYIVFVIASVGARRRSKKAAA